MKTRLEELQRHSLVVGALALAASLLGTLFEPATFYRSYLLAFSFWSGIALGALAILCLHHVVGGEWGFVSRRSLEAMVRTIVWLPLLFLPIVAGLPMLYPWVDGSYQKPYLTVGFFLARTAIYFAAWILLAGRLRKLSREQDRGERSAASRLQTVGAVGMLVYGLTVSFASVDWLMSLEPEWYSTVYGLSHMVGQGLAAFALLVPVLSLLSRDEPLATHLKISHFHDLGNLVLAFVLLWAYLAFSQYLIIWSGNLPEEITWYLNRSRGGWSAVGLALVVFHFALPFVLLLFRANKRRAAALGGIAIAILAARWLDLFWLVVPASRERVGVHWLDVAVSAGVGGIWLGLFFRQLGMLPLLPRNDPRFASTLGEEDVTRATA